MSQAEDDLSTPLLARLRKMTTFPIFLHSIKWPQLHLAIFHVYALNKNYSVKQVIGNNLFGLFNNIKDKAIADILKQILASDLNFIWYIEKL